MQRQTVSALAAFALLLGIVPLLVACGVDPSARAAGAGPSPAVTVTAPSASSTVTTTGPVASTAATPTAPGDCSAADAKIVSDSLRPVLAQIDEVKRKAQAAYDSGPMFAMNDLKKIEAQVLNLTLPACGEPSRQLALAMIESYWQNYQEASYYNIRSSPPPSRPDVYKWEDAERLKQEFTAELVRVERNLPTGAAIFTPPTATPNAVQTCGWKAEALVFLDVDGNGQMNGPAEVPLAGIDITVHTPNRSGNAEGYTTNDRGIVKFASQPTECGTADKTRKVQVWLFSDAGDTPYRATTPAEVVVRDGEQVRFGLVKK